MIKQRSMTFQVTLFTAIRLVLNTSGRMLYPFLAIFSRGLSVDLAAISLVIATSNGTSALGPILGPLADRRGRKFSMLLGLLLFTAGNVFVLVAPNYFSFFAAIVFANLGNVIFLPAMFAYLGDTVPYEKRGTVVAATETSWAGAFILGVPAAGLLINRFGWNSPFWALFGLGLISIVLILFLVPADKPIQHTSGSHFAQSFRLLFRSSRAWTGLLLGFGVVAANEIVNMVFGVWMEDSFNLQIAALGAASAAIGIAELAGEGVVAIVADRFGKERVISVGILLNIATLATLPLVNTHIWTALVWLFMFYFTFELIIVSTLPVITEVLPRARATMISAYISAVSLGRASSSAIATPIYQRNFFFNAGASILLNLVALLAIIRLRKNTRETLLKGTSVE
ncbi:MAG: MFS transporter [Anaerolineaceae bacterium]|nr:MFS transporter [Anaerolineaceae bacterium]